MSKKLSVLLGLRDKTEKNQQHMLDDMLQKFKNKQGLFKGERRTYDPIDGFADEPSKRGFTAVSSTVKEQLDWYKKYSADPFKVTFSVEKTNAGGITADLVVGGKNWGPYSTLELLRLKSILDGKLRAMINELPIRKETVIWGPTQDANYSGRDIFESPLDTGFAQTTLKEDYILHDAQHSAETPRQPQVANKSTKANIGKYTIQEFSGEFTNKQRADLQVRYDMVYTAVIEALETANNAEVQESDLGDQVLNFLF